MPSGLKATPVISASWPLSASCAARSGVPDPNHPVLATRGEARAAGAEGHAGDFLQMALEGEELAAVGGVTDPHGPVLVARGDSRAVGAEGHSTAPQPCPSR